MATGINIKFPFKDTQEGGVFAVNKITENALKDNLISLLTTRRGQRVMRANLFSPIYDYIMEPIDNSTKKQLQSAIEEQNLMTIKLVFSTEYSYGASDSITLNIPREGTETSEERDENII